MSIVLLILLIFGSLISGYVIVNIEYFVIVIIAERLVYFVLYIQKYVHTKGCVSKWTRQAAM
jgi:hypothetical protein